MLDIIILGASILDGTGSPRFQADIGISKDEIEVLGDGSGLIAAPGFIDMHSHSDFTLPTDPRSESKVRQGVTTEVIGQCGLTPAPLVQSYKEELVRSVGFFPGKLSWDWWSFADFLERLRGDGLGINVLPLVGHGTIRTAVMGMSDQKPSAEQMAEMEGSLSQCLEEGALGLSTGLIYPPGVYADTEELVQLARLVGRRGGFYFSHIRGEGETLLTAVEEALTIAKEAAIPVQISHLKASGRKNWDRFEEALALLEQARAQGLDVGADLYPYTAGSTGITALLPPWVLVGGISETKARIRDTSVRERLSQEMSQQGLSSQSGWEEILISACPLHSEYAGKYISRLAQEAGKSAMDWVLDLVAESEGEADVIIFSQKEENVRRGLSHPLVMIGTDGLGLTTAGPLAEGRPHPRNYGTYPRILGHYVREERLLSLEEAVYKMTGLPARRLRLRDRGRITPGHKADLVLFDPFTVDDVAEYAQPPCYPRGIEYVLINGQLVIEKGEHTGNMPGRILGWSEIMPHCPTGGNA
jgi:N-acyl-D-amino-acid deacylase